MAMRRAQLFVRAYNAKCCRRVWGNAPPGKFLNLDYMRVLLKPSEITITMQNLWKLDCNFGRRMVASRSPFLSESTTVWCHRCLLGASDLSALCLQDMKQ